MVFELGKIPVDLKAWLIIIIKKQSITQCFPVWAHILFKLKDRKDIKMKNFAELIEQTKLRGKKVCVIARAEDEAVLEGVKLADELNMVFPILIGDTLRIKEISQKIGFDLQRSEIIDSQDEEATMQYACRLTREKTGILMKGLVSTSTFLKGVLNKDYGLRTGRTLSHIAVLEVPGYHKLLFMSDGGMNPKLDLKIRIDLVKNGLELLERLGYQNPKVALVAASESVHPDMPETVDAVEIVKLAKEGQFGRAIVEGPFGFDVAVSKEAAEHKKIKSEIAGDTDFLIMPNISAGNIWAKGLMYFTKTKSAGIVMGAAYPVVMLSRADPPETKLHSIALGILSSL